jgi:hypothetical protein
LAAVLDITLKLTACCKACSLETTLDELTGRIVAHGETTYMVQADQPCPCGAALYCVTFAVDLAEEEAPQSR